MTAVTDYEQQAAALLAAVASGDDAAAWRFKWEHPRFRGRTVSDVRAAQLDAGDARTVIAREQAFDTWDELVTFVPDDFETGADAVVSGDLATLRAMLARSPELVHARSRRRHHATLLHY
ncbi:MAG TPA: hypothetical protein VHK90_14040, partial [Thermoanaerobaculia bacterium]|nr:hypothetical protein [Thermoanaerobaculia bacterium]